MSSELSDLVTLFLYGSKLPRILHERMALIEPPLLGAFFILGGLALAVSGFIILFGPHDLPLTHRRNNIGVLFLFCGLAVFAIAAYSTAALL